jgi:hypothetical protein
MRTTCSRRECRLPIMTSRLRGTRPTSSANYCRISGLARSGDLREASRARGVPIHAVKQRLPPPAQLRHPRSSYVDIRMSISEGDSLPVVLRRGGVLLRHDDAIPLRRPFVLVGRSTSIFRPSEVNRMRTVRALIVVASPRCRSDIRSFRSRRAARSSTVGRTRWTAPGSGCRHARG